MQICIFFAIILAIPLKMNNFAGEFEICCKKW